MRSSGTAAAHCVVSMLSAALDEVYAGAWKELSIRSGSEVTAWEPRPLETLTTTPAGALRSRGRKAWKVRTGPSTLTAKTSSTSAAVMSGMSANLAEIPALLTSTSTEPAAPRRDPRQRTADDLPGRVDGAGTGARDHCTDGRNQRRSSGRAGRYS